MVSTNGRRFVTDRYINPSEQGTYEDSLKYYRDLNNVVDTSRQEGRDEGEIRVIVRLLEKRFGRLPDDVLNGIRSLAIEEPEVLGEAQTDFDNLSDLEKRLDSRAMR